MRSIFLSLCIVLLLAGGGFSASAQQKIAYVDIATIMKEIPEAQEAQRQLDAMVDRWQKELQELGRLAGQIQRLRQAQADSHRSGTSKRRARVAGTGFAHHAIP